MQLTALFMSFYLLGTAFASPIADNSGEDRDCYVNGNILKYKEGDVC